MLNNIALAADGLIKASIFGAFCGMVVAGWIAWFAASAIGTLLHSSKNTLLANLFLGSGMLKGALLGGATGLATLGETPRAKKFPAAALPGLQSFTR